MAYIDYSPFSRSFALSVTGRCPALYFPPPERPVPLPLPGLPHTEAAWQCMSSALMPTCLSDVGTNLHTSRENAIYRATLLAQWLHNRACARHLITQKTRATLTREAMKHPRVAIEVDDLSLRKRNCRLQFVTLICPVTFFTILCYMAQHSSSAKTACNFSSPHFLVSRFSKIHKIIVSLHKIRMLTILHDTSFPQNGDFFLILRSSYYEFDTRYHTGQHMMHVSIGSIISKRALLSGVTSGRCEVLGSCLKNVSKMFLA
jgi:hypothetical protein